ncbi:methyl-accepting chemotaxis protein [Acetobacter vaccinii]|uniref:Methyl-accepting chemotaxis protein n=1 Tax=Acetobacter vaccinii TaxID=2592655 RepID=A0A5C1YRI1_9PROT|nr:methyl-accepting chemotaxis protein [Acetobacter vaccinii]QEO17537.1 methyl-accepting chemotaxis protein [Acetobacter vaccinii]
MTPGITLGLRARLFMAIGCMCLFSTLTVMLIGLRQMTASELENTQKRFVEILSHDASRVNEEIGGHIQATQALDLAIAGLLSQQPINRDVLGALAHSAVLGQKDIVGITLAFEPNGADNRDSSFIGHRYSNAAGRFVPYFFHKHDGSVGVEILTMTPDTGTAAWYDAPLHGDKAVITTPYFYPIDGVNTLLTTISMPVHRNGAAVGILTTDISLKQLGAFIGTLRPLDTGHVGLIGTGNIWVANPDPTLVGKPVDAQTLAFVGMGDKAERFITQDNGESLYQVAAPVTFPGMSTRWSIVGTVPRATLVQNAARVRDRMLVAAVITFALTMLGVWLLASGLSKPIARMTRRMLALANGDVSSPVEGTGRRDEIGAMAAAVQTFRENAMRVAALTEDGKRRDAEAAQERAERQKAEAQARARAEQERRDMLSALADDFERNVMGLVQGVASAAQQLREEVQSLTQATRDTSRDASQVTETSRLSAEKIEGVAAATEELAASIHELTRRVDESSSLSLQTAEEARRAHETIVKVQEISSQIRNVSTLIGLISRQTNLLAINTSVEAARTGMANHAFGALAREIKTLAERTASATSDIERQISNVDNVTQGAVSAIESIRNRVERVADTASSIASVVKQQSVTTDDMSSNTRSVADGTTRVSGAIANVTKATEVAQEVSNQLMSAADQLGGHSSELTKHLENFLHTLRTRYAGS